MDEEKKYEELEKYAKGEMNPEELRAFEQRMRSDEELAKEASFYRQMARGIEWKGMQEEVEGELEKEGFFNEKSSSSASTSIHQPSRRSTSRILALAAVLLLLILAGGYFYASRNYSNQALVALVYEEPGLSASLKGGEGGSQSLEAGTNAYYAGDFEKAAKLFAEIPEGTSAYPEAQYQLAHALYQQGRFEEAIPSFRIALERSSEPRIKEAAEWYLVLTYLSGNESGEPFQRLLSKILENENHRYYSFAGELEKSLNSFWRKWIHQ